MADFDALMGELDQIMAKAVAVDQSDDDRMIARAAADADPSKKDDDEDEDEGETFGKSFAVTLADGTEVDAYDGTEMVKALHATITGQAKRIEALTGQVAGAEQFNTKAVSLLKSLQAQVTSQGEMLKALREQPGGRRSVVADPAPPRPDAASRGDILAKSLAAQASGRISGGEVAQIEARLADNIPIPAELLARVNAA